MKHGDITKHFMASISRNPCASHPNTSTPKEVSKFMHGQRMKKEPWTEVILAASRERGGIPLAQSQL